MVASVVLKNILVLRVVTDDFDKATIRRTVHEVYTRKEYPTVHMLLEALHQKGRKYLKHLLKEMVQVTYNSNGAAMYMKALKHERFTNIIYLDET